MDSSFFKACLHLCSSGIIVSRMIYNLRDSVSRICYCAIWRVENIKASSGNLDEDFVFIGRYSPEETPGKVFRSSLKEA